MRKTGGLGAIVAGLIALGLALQGQAVADEGAPAKPYSGDFLSRSTLTGDWGGLRNDLASKGVTFDLNLTQVGQGVVSGGKSGQWAYGGRGDFVGRLDTQKLGLWPGGFLTLEVEGNFADSVNGRTGALMPADTNQLFPVPIGDNFNVPELSFAQFVSPYLGAIVGKLDTAAGDANEFADGKGDQQFFNLAFNINPLAIVAMPYSPLAAGVIVLPTKDPTAAIVQFLVAQSTGTASTPGFDALSADNLTFAGEGRLTTHFFRRTGHGLIGGEYSNREFTSIDQRIGLENRGLEGTDGSWAVYYNFDQYLWQPEQNGKRGIGIFGRFGASDGDPNLMQYFFSLGVGGKGPIACRPHDQFGLGYYYLDVESPTLRSPLQTRSFLRDEWGFEAYYNVALTPWLLLTPDIQVIGPSQKRYAQQVGEVVQRESVGTAVALGFRVQMIF